MCDRARGVSDVIGFVFVFSLVVTSVAAVSVVGLGGLQDARDDAQLQNTELGFDILAHNIEDIHRRGAPSRATELRLGGGRIAGGSETEITVEIGVTFSRTYTVEPIVYRSGDTRIVYEGTGVLREEIDEGAVFVREPSFVLPEASTESTAIPVVDTDVPDDAAVGGQSTALIRTAAADRSVEAANTTAVAMTIEIETTEERAAAWHGYLSEELPAGVCTYPGVDPTVVSCSFTTTRTAVTLTEIDVQYE